METRRLDQFRRQLRCRGPSDDAAAGIKDRAFGRIQWPSTSAGDLGHVAFERAA